MNSWFFIGLLKFAYQGIITLQVATRYIAQLLDSHPEHPFTKDYNAKSNEFKRLAAQYQPSVAS